MNKKNIEALYRDYSNSIFRYFFFKTSDQNTSADLTSEVFLRFMENKNTKIKNKKAFLFGIAKNLLMDKFKEKKLLDLEEVETFLEKEKPQDQLSIEEQTIKEEATQRIKKEINSLDDATKEVLILKIWEELKFNEISDILNVNVNTVKTLYYRGVENLKTKLSDQSNKKYSTALVVGGILGFAKLVEFSVPQGVYASVISATAGMGGAGFLSTIGGKLVVGGVLLSSTAIFGVGTVNIVNQNRQENTISREMNEGKGILLDKVTPEPTKEDTLEDLLNRHSLFYVETAYSQISGRIEGTIYKYDFKNDTKEIFYEGDTITFSDKFKRFVVTKNVIIPDDQNIYTNIKILDINKNIVFEDTIVGGVSTYAKLDDDNQNILYVDIGTYVNRNLNVYDISSNSAKLLYFVPVFGEFTPLKTVKVDVWGIPEKSKNKLLYTYNFFNSEFKRPSAGTNSPKGIYIDDLQNMERFMGFDGGFNKEKILIAPTEKFDYIFAFIKNDRIFAQEIEYTFTESDTDRPPVTIETLIEDLESNTKTLVFKKNIITNPYDMNSQISQKDVYEVITVQNRLVSFSMNGTDKRIENISDFQSQTLLSDLEFSKKFCKENAIELDRMCSIERNVFRELYKFNVGIFNTYSFPANNYYVTMTSIDGSINKVIDARLNPDNPLINKTIQNTIVTPRI